MGESQLREKSTHSNLFERKIAFIRKRKTHKVYFFPTRPNDKPQRIFTKNLLIEFLKEENEREKNIRRVQIYIY